MRKRLLSFLFLIACAAAAGADNQTSAFGFLELPRSAHEAALGGRTVSLLLDDPTLVYSNPAAITATSSRMLGLNVMTWLAGTTAAGAQYCDVAGKRSAFAASARYISYGVSDQTDIYGNTTGTFGSRDIALSGTYGYQLGDNWNGGVTMRMIYSNYSSYSSFAMAADLGLVYTSSSGLLSAGLTFSNLGGQLKPFQDIREKLPFNITAGVSVRLSHAPVRLTLTMDRLNKWSQSDFYSAGGELTAGDIFLRHLSFGADILITDNIYVALGYNARYHAELSTGSRKGLTGMSVGGGIRLSKMQFGLSFGKFQVSTSSLLFNFAINI